MENIMQNLKRNNNKLAVTHNVLLRKIGSNSTVNKLNYNGMTVTNVVSHINGTVNLILVTSVNPIELYIVYYDNHDMNKASSECVVQINFMNNRINLTETANSQALVREYTVNKSQTCQNIIKYITESNDQKTVVYNLNLNKNTYPVYVGSVIDKLNKILSELSQNLTSNLTSNSTSNFVNLVINDPITRTLATAATSTASDALAKSPKGRVALEAFDMFKQVANNPLAQQLAMTAASLATEQLAKSPRGKTALQVADALSPIVIKGGNYVNLAMITN